MSLRAEAFDGSFGEQASTHEALTSYCEVQIALEKNRFLRLDLELSSSLLTGKNALCMNAMPEMAIKRQVEL